MTTPGGILIGNAIRDAPTRLKVYALLVEGRAQSSICKLLGLTRQRVSSITQELEAGGYVKRIPGRTKPCFYEKGPNGNQLDTLLVNPRTEVYARGVTQASKNYARVDTAKVHHLKYRAKVLKVGDCQFLKQYFNRRNVTRSKGQIAYYEHWISVEFEETPNLKNFYVYPPELDLRPEELGDFETKASAICQDILNGLSKKAGWKFGLPEKTDWETHIAVESPALVGELAGKYYMESRDGTAFLSNSEGRDEIEFKGQKGKDQDAIEQAKIILELPGEVITLKTTTHEIVETLGLMNQSLVLIAKGFQEISNFETIHLKTELAKASAIVEAAKAELEAEPKTEEEDGKSSKKKDVMYQ